MLIKNHLPKQVSRSNTERNGNNVTSMAPRHNVTLTGRAGKSRVVKSMLIVPHIYIRLSVGPEQYQSVQNNDSGLRLQGLITLTNLEL